MCYKAIGKVKYMRSERMYQKVFENKYTVFYIPN